MSTAAINQSLPQEGQFFQAFGSPDPRSAEFPLIGSPWPIFTIIATYVYFVKVLGPNWMKDRKPFKIEPLIVAYNVLMVILSGYFFLEGGRLTYFSGKYNLMCQPVDHSNNPDAVRLVYLGWWFMMLKITEFADTIFFVLKKNNRQISNLHVIHHSLVVFGSYVGMKFVPGGHGIFFPLINCFVHVVMYTYYCLSAMGPSVRKHLWWKKYLTQFQMGQFIIATIHGIIPLYYNCGYPSAFSYCLIFAGVLFLAMFANFYLKNYNKDKLNNNNNGNTLNNNVNNVKSDEKVSVKQE